jgi:uncharacterized membrane protein YfcA
MMDGTLILVGWVVGTLIGITGVGGASLLTPILLFFGIPPLTAIGTDLVYNSFTKGIGAIRHFRLGHVSLGMVFRLAAGSIPGAMIGVASIQWFNEHIGLSGEILKNVIGLILVFTSLFSMYRDWKKRDYEKDENEEVEVHTHKFMVTIAIGASIGFMVGLTSIGSGTLFAIILYHFFAMTGKELVGTDIAHAFLLTTFAGVIHWSVGNVVPGIVISLLIGSIPGVWFGSRWTEWIPPNLLKKLLWGAIFISGWMLI